MKARTVLGRSTPCGQRAGTAVLALIVGPPRRLEPGTRPQAGAPRGSRFRARAGGRAGRATPRDSGPPGCTERRQAHGRDRERGRCPPTGTGCSPAPSRMRAHRIAPVSPMPPSVASNSPSSAPGESSTTSPLDVSSAIEGTWLPNVPAVPWFFPWISLAIAPPTDTCCVPGTTGTIHPAARDAPSSSPIVTPAPAGDRSLVGRRVRTP